MHKRKSGKAGVNFLSMFLTRAQDMSTSHDPLMLTMRLAREALASGQGTSELWAELAGILNVCGYYANDTDNQEWYSVLQQTANALRSIEERHRRVGGRYAGNEQEIHAITVGLNLIDYEILPKMALIDFCRYADKVNAMTKDAQ